MFLWYTSKVPGVMFRGGIVFLVNSFVKSVTLSALLLVQVGYAQERGAMEMTQEGLIEKVYNAVEMDDLAAVQGLCGGCGNLPFYSNDCGETWAHVAARNNAVNVLAWLINEQFFSGWECDYSGNTPMHAAASANALGAFEWLNQNVKLLCTALNDEVQVPAHLISSARE